MMRAQTELIENRRFIEKTAHLINKNNYYLTMDFLYKYVKMITNDYYNNEYMIPEYSDILETLLYVEETSHYNKIFDFDMPILYKDEKEPVDYIEKLIFDSRRNLLNFHNMDKINTNHVNFANKCIHASQTVFCKCTTDNVKSYIVKVHPGYKRGNNIENDLRCHYFNIVYYDNKYYLIDLSYAQFFAPNKNVFSRLGVVGTDGCDVGIYMMQNDKSKKIVKKIIKDGYIELNEDVFKTYMDAFTLSFRNGLYYDSNNINSFEVGYSVDDYVKFILEEDNQINHEGLENLGKQRKPLKNNEIDFNTFVK